jgi:hypothetical protein
MTIFDTELKDNRIYDSDDEQCEEYSPEQMREMREMMRQLRLSLSSISDYDSDCE